MTLQTKTGEFCIQVASQTSMNVEQALKADLQIVLEPKMYKVIVMVTNEWIISMFRTVRR